MRKGFYFLLDDELYNMLRLIAQKHYLSMSAYIRHLIREAIIKDDYE